MTPPPHPTQPAPPLPRSRHPLVTPAPHLHAPRLLDVPAPQLRDVAHHRKHVPKFTVPTEARCGAVRYSMLQYNAVQCDHHPSSICLPWLQPPSNTCPPTLQPPTNICLPMLQPPSSMGLLTLQPPYSTCLPMLQPPPSTHHDIHISRMLLYPNTLTPACCTLTPCTTMWLYVMY